MVAAETLTGSARERLLDAAERIASDVGAARLTLDAVCHGAAVSKGGLLYHFPSKEALLTALTARYLERLRNCVDTARAALPANEPGRDLKARVVGLLADGNESKAVVAALLAAAANDPTLLDGIRDRLAEDSAELAASPVGFARAAVVALAIDGLRTREALRVSSFSPTQRQALVDELLRLATPEAAR